MKYSFTVLIGLLLSSTSCFCQEKNIDSLLLYFKDALFEYKVKPAKKALENYQQLVIPKIIPLLYNRSYVVLVGNPFMMYPANNNFEPTHGYFIPYNLDWISLRAGWLVEDLTFMDFGYKTELDEKRLSEVYANLYNTSSNNQKITDLHWINKPTKDSLTHTRQLMANNVAAWWHQNKAHWTRLNAIEEALKSNNKNRLLKVIAYLQNGETQCDSLTIEVYLQTIKPLVTSLKQSQYQTVKDEAEQLLKDGLSSDIVSELSQNK